MKKRNHAIFLSTCAILSAFSIIFGKYLALNLGTNIRFSLENLPILLAGLYLGPAAGAIVGTVADLLGCLLVGFSINPIITFGAMCIGLISGLAGKFCGKRKIFTLAVATAFSHLIGSVLIKSMGLYIYYGSPLLLVTAQRLGIYICTGSIEFIILLLLSKNKGFVKQMNKIRFKEG